MRGLSVLLGLTVAIAATLLLSACGGGDGQPTRPLTTHDLQQMVIQAEDLGPGYTLTESHEGFDAYPPEGAIDAYEVRYRFEADAEVPNGVKTAVSEVDLFPTTAEAKSALAGLEEGPWEDPQSGAFIRKVAVPDLGDQTSGWLMHLAEGITLYGGPHEALETFVVFVRRGEVVWSLMAGGEGASSDDVIRVGTDLATKQQERVEAVLKGGPKP